MEEKLLVSLQELKSAIDSGGSIDTGDLSYDSLKTILEFFIEQEKENKRYIIKMTDEQYSRVIELVECDINKKWKSKIKAKIEEIKEEVKTCYIYKKTGYCTNNCKEDCFYYDVIDILQRLLQKE